MILRRPPYPLPTWWFDESSEPVRWLLAKVNLGQSAKQLAKQFTGLGPARSRRVLRHRPWDGYQSLVELLQIDGIGVWVINEMLEDVLKQRRMSVRDRKRYHHAHLQVRDRLYRPDRSKERSFLDEDELVQLLLWTETERAAMLVYANQIRTQKLHNVTGFTSLYAGIAKRIFREAPFSDLYDLASFAGIGVARMRTLRLGMLVDPKFTANDLPALLLPIRLETRYDGPALKIRVYPDEVHLEEHRTGLVRLEGEHTLDEVGLAEHFWQAAASSKLSPDAMRGAFDTVADRVGAARAAYIIQTHVPDNLASLSDGEVPLFPPAELAGDSRVTLYGVPEYFVFRVTRADESYVEVYGQPIDRDLAFGVPDLEALDPSVTWLTDFEVAVAAGMGVVVPWPHSDGPVSVTAFGLSALDDGATFAEHLRRKSWVHPVVFAEDGSRTNTTNDSPSGYTTAGARNDRFADVVAFVESRPLPESASALTMARWLGAELDLPAAASARNEGLIQKIYGIVFDSVFWPAMTFVVGRDGRQARGPLREWFVNHVRADGPLPAIRVGANPYGLLPIGKPDGSDSSRAAISRVVEGLIDRQRAHIPNPFDGDPTAAVLTQLSRAPHPTAWGQRAFVDDGLDVATAVDQLRAMLPRRDRADSPVVWDVTFGPFLAHIDAVLAWAANPQGARPSRSISPRHVRGVGDSQAERSRLTREVSTRLVSAISLCRSGHVPSIWTRIARWWENVPGYQSAVDSAKYKPWGTNASARRQNQERARSLLQGLVHRGNKVRTWLEWDDAQSTASEMLTLLHDAFYQESSRVDQVSDLLASLWGSPLGGGRIASSVPGPIRDAADRVRAELALGAWVRSPEGQDVVPLLHRLAGDDTAAGLIGEYGEEAVEWVLRGAVGVASYRVDAWELALAHAQLEAFRTAQERNEAPQGSIRIGSFGVVLDLPSPGGVPRASEGYVLAPSMPHAATAAVLRSGWLAHDPTDADGAMAIALRGERLPNALSMLQAVRDGEDLDATLGWMVEKALTDGGRGDLVGPLREAVTGRSDSVVPGFAALHLRDRVVLGAGEAEDAEGTIPFLDEAFATLLHPVADSLDAIADLTEAEGVHQLLRRSPERAQVALDALTVGLGAVPNRFDVLDSPGVSRSEAFECVVVHPVASTTSDAFRAHGAPTLNAWVESLLKLDALRVEFKDGPTVSLASLGVCGLDVVYDGLDGLMVRAAEVASFDGPLVWADTDHSLWRQLVVDLRTLLGRLQDIGDDGATGDRSVWKDRAGPLLAAWLAAAAAPDKELGRSMLGLHARAGAAAALERRGAAGSHAHSQFVAAVKREAEELRALANPTDDDDVRALLERLTGLPVVAERVSSPDWVDQDERPPMEAWARVRPAVEAWHLMEWTLDAIDELPTPPHAVLATHGDRNVVRIGVTGSRWCGWRLDSWSEAIPDDRAVLGAAIHADAPGAMPPAAWVFAMPPEKGWNPQTLADTVDTVIDAFKRRGVGPNQLASDAELGQRLAVLPLLVENP